MKFIRIKMVRQFVLIILLGIVAVANAQTDRQFIREGNRMYHKQDYAKAEVLYRKAISKNASNPQALYNLGCALMMQNKDSAAVGQYLNSVKLEKNKLRLSGIYHNIGVIFQKNRMYGEAIKAYEQSLRNNPKDNETRYNLVLCKRLQKKQNGNGGNNKKQNDKEDQNKEDNNNDNSKGKNKQQKPKEQMSKDNAEQLLNAAVQNEKATQQRLKKALQKPGSRHLQKNW